jgi:hypothetical protein
MVVSAQQGTHDTVLAVATDIHTGSFLVLGLGVDAWS